MYRCAAPNCTVMAGKGVSLFYFPKKDDKRCREWVDKLKRKDFTPSNTSKLCARHFTNDSFTMHPATAKLVNFRKLFLRRDAVPSIFEYSPESPPERKPSPENEPGPSAAKLGRHEEKTTVFKTHTQQGNMDDDTFYTTPNYPSHTRQGNIEESISVEGEGDIQLDTTSVFNNIFYTDTFNSFEEFDFFFKKYQYQTGSLFRVKSSSSAIKENDRREQKIPLELKYASVSFVCVRYGSPKRKGLGIRPKQRYLPCGCNVFVALSVRKNRLIITKMYLQHNHEPELYHQSSLDGGRARKRGTKRKHATPVVSFVNSFCQTIPAKSQKKTGSQSGNQNSENGEKRALSCSMKSSISEADPPVAPEQPAASKEQMLAPSTQISVAKTKPGEKPRQQEKRFFVVAGHQRYVLCRLASLWKKGILCDAGLSNGSFTVKVHKLVLHAMCPRLFSVSSKDIRSHGFLQLNVPKEVGEEALNAFAEYMYTGILDLDSEILEQFKIIAKRLDMKEFEGLCDTRLASTKQQQPNSATVSSADSFTNVPSVQTATQVPGMTSSVESPGSSVSSFMKSATVSTALSFNNVPLTQTTTPVLAMTKSPDSPVSASIQSSPSIDTPVVDIKQEISEDKVAAVKMEDAAMFGQESEVTASLAPNISGNESDSVITPSIKIELVGPADDQYGHWSGNSGYQTSLSSSIASSVPSSSTEFVFPSSEETDAKTTRLKALHSYEPCLIPDSSPVSSCVETMHTQSSSMKKHSSSQSSNAAPSMDAPKSHNAVYPVRLFTARGDNLPLITKDSSDATKVDSFITKEKT